MNGLEAHPSFSKQKGAGYIPSLCVFAPVREAAKSDRLAL
jgi:hypothetical protein